MKEKMRKKSLRSVVLLALITVFSLLILGGIYLSAIACDTAPCGGTWYYCTWVECGKHPEIYMCCKPKIKI